MFIVCVYEADGDSTWKYLEWPQNHAQIRHIPQNGNGHDVAANDAQRDGLSVSWMLEISRDERLILSIVRGK